MGIQRNFFEGVLNSIWKQKKKDLVENLGWKYFMEEFKQLHIVNEELSKEKINFF